MREEEGNWHSRQADERDRIAQERVDVAEERDRLADEREHLADDAEGGLTTVAPPSAQALVDALARNAEMRSENAAEQVAQRARSGAAAAPPTEDWEPDKRDFVADDRQQRDDQRELIADERERLADLREDILRDLAVAVGMDAAGRGRATSLLVGHHDRAARNAAGTARGTAAGDRLRADHELAMTRRSNFAAELVAVARALVNAETIDGALDEIVHAAVRTIDACEAATFSMVAPGGGVTTPAASERSGPAVALDMAQYTSGEGPSLEAITTEGVIRSADVAADHRWPGLHEHLAGLPYRSTLCVPVIDERRHVVLGSLNHYSSSADGFEDSDEESAVLVAAHLGAVLTLALDAAAAGRRVVELGHAVQTRDVIGQAKGILMERQRLSADQAFDVLRRASQHLNRKLTDVADELASTGLLTREPE